MKGPAIENQIFVLRNKPEHHFLVSTTLSRQYQTIKASETLTFITV